MPDTMDDRFNQIVAENIRLEQDMILRRWHQMRLEQDTMWSRSLVGIEAAWIWRQQQAKAVRDA